MDKNCFRKQDRFWNQLIGLVAKGNVVPIIGEDMLLLNDPPNYFLYDELARRYAEYNEIEQNTTEKPLLSSTVRNHPDFRDNPHDIYQSIGEELDDWEPDIPRPLIDVARVKHFNLFISTTFDNLLEKAINQERFNGQSMTHVFAYSPKNIPTDKDVSEALASGRPVIIQLFGSYKNPLQFALTEGDKVEYMHALQSSEYCPKRIFNELYDRPLIILGNNFPDWLARMFLRMSRKTPLDYREVPKQYFADNEANSDTHLRNFLHRFTTNTQVVDNQKPVQFMSTLIEKWQEKYSNEDITPQLNTLYENKPMPRNAVFISYCASNADGSTSTDYHIALALKKALEKTGIDVWLDKDELKGGDEYERKIERYINTCSLFIPLISVTTNSRPVGFFRKEWNWALRKLPNFTGSNRPFLLPIALQGIDPYSSLVPDEFKHIQFLQLSHDEPDEKIIKTIMSNYHQALM